MKKCIKTLTIIGAIMFVCIFINAPYASAQVSSCFWAPATYFSQGTNIHWCTLWYPLNVFGWEGLYDYTNGHWEVGSLGPIGVYGGGRNAFQIPHNGYFIIYSVCPPPNYPITSSTVWFE